MLTQTILRIYVIFILVASIILQSAKPTSAPNLMQMHQIPFQLLKQPIPSPQLSTQTYIKKFQHPLRPLGGPSNQPTEHPTHQPGRKPYHQPSFQPSRQPSLQPLRGTSLQPSNHLSSRPSSQPFQSPSYYSLQKLSSHFLQQNSPIVQSALSVSHLYAGQLLICQSGYGCKADSDCVSGNKCIIVNTYVSQCVADTSTYLNPLQTSCIVSYGAVCDDSSQCCDPGAICNSNPFRQCSQPVKEPLCRMPGGGVLPWESVQSTAPPSSRRLPSRQAQLAIGTPSGQSNKQLICQYSGYCLQDSDCVAGNKCNIAGQYYSQCIPDPNQYLSGACVTSYNMPCDGSTICCDPGAICVDANGGSQCAPIQFPLCSQPTAFVKYLPSQKPSVSSKLSVPTPTLDPSAAPQISIPRIAPTARPAVRSTKSPVPLPTVAPSVSPSTERTSYSPSLLPSIEPTMKPKCDYYYYYSPSSTPTRCPSLSPSAKPTKVPSIIPTVKPSGKLSCIPSIVPSAEPTKHQSNCPSTIPTSAPPSNAPASYSPSLLPNFEPTMIPTYVPSSKPTRCPTFSPSAKPTKAPSSIPTVNPSKEPSYIPSIAPSAEPTMQPSNSPSAVPTVNPSVMPSTEPTSCSPSLLPSFEPTMIPTYLPSSKPTRSPRFSPSAKPTKAPSSIPTVNPSREPSYIPSIVPSAEPTVPPSNSPITVNPSVMPFTEPTSMKPSSVSSIMPTAEPTIGPSDPPSTSPTGAPSPSPTIAPSFEPSYKPSGAPTVDPTSRPTSFPSFNPTNAPTQSPSRKPSIMPSCKPSSNGPTTSPSTLVPSSLPTCYPSVSPSTNPTIFPSTFPSIAPSVNPTLTSSIEPSFISSVPPSTSTTTPVVPSIVPSAPSGSPTLSPSGAPSATPTVRPKFSPSIMPTTVPTPSPTTSPSFEPTFNPNMVLLFESLIPLYNLSDSLNTSTRRFHAAVREAMVITLDLSYGSFKYLGDSIHTIQIGRDNVNETLVVSHMQSILRLSNYSAYVARPSRLFHSLRQNLSMASENGHFTNILRNRLKINFGLSEVPGIAVYGNITSINFQITYMPDNSVQPVPFPTSSPLLSSDRFSSPPDYWIFVAQVVAITVGVIVAIIVASLAVYFCYLRAKRNRDDWESNKLHRARLFDNLSDYHMNRSMSRAGSSSFRQTDRRAGGLQRQFEKYGMVSVSADSAEEDRTRVIFDEANAMLQLDLMMASPFNPTSSNSNTEENNAPVPVHVKVKLPARAAEVPTLDLLGRDRVPPIMTPAAGDLVWWDGNHGEVSRGLPRLKPSD